MNTATIAAPSNVTPFTQNLKTPQPKQQTAKDAIAVNVQALIEQLEQGHSAGLTAYLIAMGRFHNYSFGNVLEIARQRLVTYCYTSLASINIRVCALLTIINGNATRVHFIVGHIAEVKPAAHLSDMPTPKIASSVRPNNVAFFMNKAGWEFNSLAHITAIHVTVA